MQGWGTWNRTPVVETIVSLRGRPRFTAFPHKAGENGIEPLYWASKAHVLPLDDSPALCGISRRPL